MPTIRPVRRFTSRTVSSFSTSGSAMIFGSCTSNMFRRIRSAPMEAANSALVTSVSRGIVMPIVSLARTLPSLPAIASISSLFVACVISSAVIFKIRFAISDSPSCFADKKRKKSARRQIFFYHVPYSFLYFILALNPAYRLLLRKTRQV